MVSPQSVIALVGMTGERVKGSRVTSSSNTISSDAKTRATKALGVGAVSVFKCGM